MTNDGRKHRWSLTATSSTPPPTRSSTPAPSTRGISNEDLDIAFQPIVDLTSRRIFAYEALTRCRWPEYKNPARLFSRAAREGSCGRLGRIVLEVAFSRCSGIPLFVNVHPDELSARWLVRPDDPIFVYDDNVFVEITESAAFSHYDLCFNVLREVGSRAGVNLAVDDLGAGFSNLKRVLDLEPKVVKLDRALVTGLDINRRQQTLVRYVVDLCVDLGALVVAEGIETVDELKAVQDVGAHYGQGYLFARPGYPLPKAKWPGEESLPPETAARTRFSRR